MQISISGFIPTYNNNSETLITAIKSLEEQTVKLKKISVYDDGSKGDLDVRSLSANIVYKKYNKNRGNEGGTRPGWPGLVGPARLARPG